MGVPGLWGILQDARSSATLQQLAEKAWTSPHRGLRVGVDASLWIFHSKKVVSLGVEVGPNADLRTLFYRLCALLSRGVLPLFVLDGPSRPAWKRGSFVGYGGKGSQLDRDFCELIELMGMGWRRAKGEAEAELAKLAQMGELDAVISDDVDTLVFCCPVVIRNDSLTLTGNKTQPSLLLSPSNDVSRTPVKSDIVLYRLSDVLLHIHLTPLDLVLVALLSGGDYHPAGIEDCGIKFALGLAHAGFAKPLAAAVDAPDPSLVLSEWRESVAHELETNSSGLLPSRRPSTARTLRSATRFPDIDVLRAYLHPSVNLTSRQGLFFDAGVDVPSLTAWCSKTFEWPVRELTTHFRSVLWKGLLVHELRRSLLACDQNLPPTVKNSRSYGAAHEMIAQIHETKKADSTDGVESYRVELAGDFLYAYLVPHLPDPDPFALVDEAAEPALTSEGEGDGSPRKQTRAKTGSKDLKGRGALSHWVPIAFFEGNEGCKKLVVEFECRAKDKKEKKEGKGKGKASAPPIRTKQVVLNFGTTTKPSTSNATKSRRLIEDTPPSSPDLPPIPTFPGKTRPTTTVIKRRPPPVGRSSSPSDLPETLFSPSSSRGVSISISPKQPIDSASSSRAVKKPTEVIVLSSSPDSTPARPVRSVPLSPTKRQREGVIHASSGGKRVAHRDEAMEGRWDEVDVLCLSD